MYVNTEIMFPPSVIPLLRDACGPAWRGLVERVAPLADTQPESLAFSLMMIRLGNCLTCDLDSYRASLGCSACAKRTVASFKGTDEALIKKIEDARKEIRAYVGSAPRPR